MIGMMYLVLTAMLALNVAKEVLNAFILVDEGLVTTTENFAAKNASLYNNFAQAYAMNPEKVGDWKDKSDQVQIRSNELYSFMHECKTDILSIKEPEAIDPDYEIIHWDHVEAKDNMDHPAQVMIVEGKATELKNKIIEYREFMIDMIEDKEKYAFKKSFILP